MSLAMLLVGLPRGSAHAAEPSGKPVDGDRIVHADAEPGNWLSYGRTYSEQRYSPLARINDQNARSLGLAWFADLDTNRAQEATPLIVVGVMYVSTAWSLVKAYDARSGRLLWAYDPQVHRELGLNACCDVGNRGVAAWNHKIFVGAYDGRLIALDAATGTPVWSTLTVDTSKPYTITQAPRVIKGRVIIGNSGGE
jgi:glucose dehydrogenase